MNQAQIKENGLLFKVSQNGQNKYEPSTCQDVQQRIETYNLILNNKPNDLWKNINNLFELKYQKDNNKKIHQLSINTPEQAQTIKGLIQIQIRGFICNIYKDQMKMQEEEGMHFQLFDDQAKLALFDILATNIKFNAKPFSEQDFKVDLVMRLKVPAQALIPKQWEVTFDKLFKNTPSEYEQVYLEILDYVHYLTVTDPLIKESDIPEKQTTTRLMTTLKSLMNPQPINKTFINRRLDEEDVIIDCEYAYLSHLDTFTVMYNMLMVVLQRNCGFHVRTFLMENTEDEEEKGNNVIYFLLSQSNENLMKMADQVQLKKEVVMADIDYSINQPADSHGRPLKFNSYFQNQPDFANFAFNDKMISRSLGIKQIGIKKQIYNEASMNHLKASKYRQYCEQLCQQLVKLHRSEQIIVTQQEKSYIYNFNRHKINAGCFQLLYQKKIKRAFYAKIQELNQKYAYDYNQYDESYFEFKLPSKNKPFFNKLDHILTYKNYTLSNSGQLSLFTKLQRIKLAYYSLKHYVKMDKFLAIGLDVYALHDKYELFGDRTYQDNSEQISVPEGGSLRQAFHPFLPFLSSIKKIRQYMGENATFEIMIKIYLVSFFLLVSPLSVISQIILRTYFASTYISYRFFLIQLAVIVFCLSLFVQVWAKKQNKYFNNYAHTFKLRSFREGFAGPYFRNLTTDKLNEHYIDHTLKQRIVNLICYLIIITIIVLEGFFFYGIRIAIVSTYQTLPQIKWNYISLPHLIFYGVYFVTNHFLYYLVFVRLFNVLARWQNFALKNDHDQKVRLYRYCITFGVQLMGPIFFYIVQPFRGVSCYAAQCSSEFSDYVYSRYAILFIYIFLKFHLFIWTVLKTGVTNQILRDENERIKKALAFEDRLNYLLTYVKSEYKKSEVVEDLRDQSLALYYYVLFKIKFPFCTILNFLFLELNYIFERIESFRNKRRPIPVAEDLFKQYETFMIILHLCIIFNTWSITFSQEFVQYDFKHFITTFVPDITSDGILTLKIFITGGLIIFYETFSFILRRLFQIILYDPLQKRKQAMYKKYLYKIRDKPSKVKQLQMIPVKTIFRTFTYDGVLENKKQKYKLYEAYKSHNKSFKEKKLTMMMGAQLDSQKPLRESDINLNLHPH